MKIKKILFCSVIFFILFAISNVCFAAVAINGSTTWTNVTANTSFSASYQMRNAATSTLGTNKLDPHLTTASDWGIVTYLATSDYGNLRSIPGDKIAISSNNGPSNLTTSKNFYTTTGNASGVMDFGRINNYTSTYTFNSAIYENYTGSYSNITTLVDYMDTKYVEKISTSTTYNTTRGQCLAEVDNWFGSNNYQLDNTFPIISRYSAFNIGYMSSSAGSSAQGTAFNVTTFRPAIWNINTIN